jgi:hypothetical protein
VRGPGVGGRGAGDSPGSAARRAGHGLHAGVLDNRQLIPTAAFHQHPVRFVRKPPRPAPLPDAVWVSAPKPGPPEGGNSIVHAGRRLKVVDKFRPDDSGLSRSDQ